MRYHPAARRGIPVALALATSLAVSSAMAFTQAPMLDKLVQDKKLEPVDKRLPEKPQVIKPLDRVGIYGGTLRTAMRSNNDHNSILRMTGNQGLTRWAMDFNSVEPNLAERWEVGAEAREFTFHLRKGTKWSDGSPFTADDVLFSMNDLVGNKQFLTNPPSQFVVNDKLAEVTKLDDYTVKFKFVGPYLVFPEQLAAPLAQYPTLYQKKYCSQFHPKYNPKVNELLAKENAKDWASLMRIKCGDIEIPTRWGNPEKPTLDPWVIKEPYSGSATKILLERNPYFWQVDTKGQQLPYLDRVQFQVISEIETIVLAVINGQLDYQHRHIFPVQNRPVLLENSARGGYKVMSFQGVLSNAVGLQLNHTTKNEKLRKLIRNHDFRVALSIGTDRKEINDIVFLGQGTPWQLGPAKGSKWYNEKLSTQHLNYDPKKANEILDKLGLAKRDAEGFRLYPEGGRISMNAITAIHLTQQIEALELMRKQWQKVGIELVIQTSERSLFYDRAQANDYDISVDVMSGTLDAPYNPRSYIAIHPLDSRMSVLWTKWFLSDGKQGEEPSPSMKKRLALFEQYRASKTQAEAEAAFKALLQEAADELEVLGVVRPPDDTAIRKANLLNVYERMPASWTYPTPAPSLPQQWFFSK